MEQVDLYIVRQELILQYFKNFQEMLEQTKIQVNKCVQFIHTVNGDLSKTAKIIKRKLLTAMTSPEYQCYCG